MTAVPNLFEIAGRNSDLYENYYRELDPQGLGKINAPQAAAFLKRSRLSNEILAQIWTLSDQGSKGYLDKSGLYVALKLVALAQNDQDLLLLNLRVDLPPPSLTGAGGSGSMLNSPAKMPLNPPSSAPVDDWAVKQIEREKYEQIFESLNPVDGFLSGDQVKPVLLNSGLPANILGKVWTLSDVDQDGKLDKEEMILALHLVYRALDNDPVPSVLPQNLIPPSKRSRSSSTNRRTSLPVGAVPVLPTGVRGRSTSIASSGELGSSYGGMGGSLISGGGSSSAINNVGMSSYGSQSVGGSPKGPMSRSLAATPTPMSSMPIKPPEAWVVDGSKYEGLFLQSDTNHDGLVSGGDIRNILLQTGLPQNYLAHIWALVDINKTGTLNKEQFALAMHLVERKRNYNEEPPPTLPPDLVPPSFRASPAGMTDEGTSTHHVESDLSRVSSGNKEIEGLNNELATLQRERRDIDSSVMQLETDMTVRQSEIKNLEIELNTLESTVKQLERQQGEAQRRLDNLDIQKDSLRKSLDEMMTKLSMDETEINMMRSELDQTSATAQQTEHDLNEKRMKLHQLRDEENRMEVKLQMEKANLDTAAQQHGGIEKNIRQAESELSNLRGSTEGYKIKLNELGEVVSASSWARLDQEEASLLAQPQRPVQGTLMHMGENKWTNSGYQANAFATRVNSRPRPPEASGGADVLGLSFGASSLPSTSTPNAVDPFKSVEDPFASGIAGGMSNGNAGSVDPFAGDPFGMSAPDPFASSNGGGADPFGEKDPFASSGGGASGFGGADPFGATAAPPKKMPPPRPAPPKSRSQTPKSGAATPSDPFSNAADDPFAGAATGGTSNDGFANFADFANFS